MPSMWHKWICVIKELAANISFVNVFGQSFFVEYDTFNIGGGGWESGLV